MTDEDKHIGQTDLRAAVGSGGNYALSAARALIEETELDAEQIARKAMKIAADICVYTNGNLTVETLGD